MSLWHITAMGWRGNKGSIYYQKFRDKCFDVIGRVCVECGSTENLEIDHKDRSQKKFGVSKMMAPSRWPEVLEELRKCQPLCSKCHKKKSKQEMSVSGGQVKHGTLYQYGRGCRCDECRMRQSEYKRQWRAETGQTKSIRNPYKKAVCGTVSMYKYHGCRCSECRAANAAANRKFRNGRLVERQTQCA